jgi:hypothetical protein
MAPYAWRSGALLLLFASLCCCEQRSFWHTLELMVDCVWGCVRAAVGESLIHFFGFAGIGAAWRGEI